MKVTALTVIGWTKEYSTEDVISWCIPRRVERPEPIQWHTFYHLAPGTDRGELRVVQCHYNQPDDVGYSVCCFPRAAAITSHRSSHQETLACTAQPSFAVWLYMPLDAGEKIAEI